MIVIHGSWVNNCGDDGCFCLWAESSLKAAGKGRRAAKTGVPAHPYTISSVEMKSVLKSLNFPGILRIRSKQVEIMLPALNNIPRASTRIISQEYYEIDKDAKLAKWKVNCAFLPAFESFMWLLRCMESDEKSNPEVIFSGDIQYWMKVAKFLLELIIRERFVPSIREKNSRIYGTWKPVLSDERDRERFKILAGSVPPVCRSVEEGVSGQRASVQDMVSGALTGFLDSVLRYWIDSREYEYLENKCFYRDDVFSIWIEALSSDRPEIKASKHQKRILLEHLEPWAEVLYEPDREVPWITCFKLENPAEGQDLWDLSFHLQSSEDKSLMIPLERIWHNDEQVKGVVKDDDGCLHERTIGDIAKAAKLFPPIERSLEAEAPSFCQMSTDEAYRFLKEGACLLEESGYNVSIPGWWLNRERKLGVGLKMKQSYDKAGEAGESYFTMDSLINFDWEVALGDEKISKEEFEKIAQLKVPLVKFHGKWVEVNRDNIKAILKIISNAEKKGISLANALKMKFSGQEEGVNITECDFIGWVDRIISGQERFSNIEVPRGFNGKLRPYQEKGFSWMNYITQKRFGICLADDMGLGKTIQFLALIMHHKEKAGMQKPVLLLCPTSIVGNWKREAERFTPGLRVMIHHGVKRLAGKEFAEAAQKHDLVLSTYSLGLRDKSTLSLVDWYGTVLDEAQGIKNPQARQTRAIREIAKGYRIALTGTPVENRLSELWSIMEFLNPGYLGNYSDFRRSTSIPIERYNDEVSLQRLKSTIQPFMLRRMKTDKSIIKDLPSKTEMKVYCNLNREQATLYKAVVNEMMNNVQDSEGIQRKGLILASLTKLKQICNHPALFLKDMSDVGERSEKLNRLVQMAEEVLSGGSKMLIFTQFVGMGNMLQSYLQSHFAREVLFLHGGLRRTVRDSMIRQFQEQKDGPPVFVLSTRAGGFGLNLTRANYVFHFDRWWNPAVENQATDRAYRIGQERNVVVYKFICTGTLEERIDEMLEHKKGLAESIISSGESWLTELSNDKLKEIFAIREDVFDE